MVMRARDSFLGLASLVWLVACSGDGGASTGGSAASTDSSTGGAGTGGSGASTATGGSGASTATGGADTGGSGASTATGGSGAGGQAQGGAGGTPCTPADEICNGADDDCDGAIDESPAGADQPCDSGLPGACAQGLTVCTGGALTCVPVVTPGQQPELCNGTDDDCDGAVDQDNPEGGADCMTGEPGICGPGSTQCLNGAVACVGSAMPQEEACNGIDDDCDGAVDNGDPGAGQPCATGMQGVCSAGTTTCNNGVPGCAQSALPAPEKCNNLDDDCDGLVDEGQPEACQVCGPPGPPGTCPAYSLCVNGVVMCGPQGPAGPGPCFPPAACGVP